MEQKNRSRHSRGKPNKTKVLQGTMCPSPHLHDCHAPSTHSRKSSGPNETSGFGIFYNLSHSTHRPMELEAQHCSHATYELISRFWRHHSGGYVTKISEIRIPNPVQCSLIRFRYKEGKVLWGQGTHFLSLLPPIHHPTISCYESYRGVQ